MKKMSEMGRVKGLIVFAMLLLLFFGYESYYLYFEYIPLILAPYASTPDTQAHLKEALYVLAGNSRHWFLLLEGCIIGLIIAYYIKTKKKKDNEAENQ